MREPENEFERVAVESEKRERSPKKDRYDLVAPRLLAIVSMSWGMAVGSLVGGAAGNASAGAITGAILAVALAFLSVLPRGGSAPRWLRSRAARVSLPIAAVLGPLASWFAFPE